MRRLNTQCYTDCICWYICSNVQYSGWNHATKRSWSIRVISKQLLTFPAARPSRTIPNLNPAMRIPKCTPKIGVLFPGLRSLALRITQRVSLCVVTFPLQPLCVIGHCSPRGMYTGRWSNQTSVLLFPLKVKGYVYI